MIISLCIEELHLISAINDSRCSYIELESKVESIPVQGAPAMVKRRMSGAAKLAVKLPVDEMDVTKVDYALFASEFGEVKLREKLYSSMVAHQQFSPMQFSQSVHNASSGLFNIIKQNKIPSQALAASGAELGCALTLAGAYLNNADINRVLICISQEDLPREFSDLACREPFALAMIVSADRAFPSFELLASDALSLTIDSFLTWWNSTDK